MKNIKSIKNDRNKNKNKQNKHIYIYDIIVLILKKCVKNVTILNLK